MTDELQRAQQHAEALRHVAAHLNAQFELEASLMAVCKESAQVLAVPVVTISLYDATKEELYLAYDFGLSAKLRQQMQGMPRAVYDAYRQLAGPMVVTADVQALPDLPNLDLYIEMDLRTTVSVSLQWQEVLIGRLNIGTIGKVRHFTQADLDLLQAIADQASMAIHRAMLYEQVQAHAAKLEERVSERTAELQIRNEELDAFAHTVAHDLKTPLAVICGYAEMLQSNAAKMTPESIDSSLSAIFTSSLKMVRIVNELLLLASMNKEEIPLKPVDMFKVIQEVQARLKQMLHEYQAELILSEDAWPVALGHAPWIEEIWANYISNAIKYGGERPRIEVTARPLANNMVRFEVRDNGDGITEEDQAKLFTPFTQLASGRKRGSSHGLGLSIVQRIAEKLGGQAGCESQLGQGSVFYFTLPQA
jgi:signal transduction histidine kinase